MTKPEVYPIEGNIHVLDSNNPQPLPEGWDTVAGKFVTYQAGKDFTKIIISRSEEWERSDGAPAALRHAEMMWHLQRLLGEGVSLFADARAADPDIESIDQLDAGRLKLDTSTVPPTLTFYDRSLDWDRGSKEDRALTCHMAQRALGESVHVVNGDD